MTSTGLRHLALIMDGNRRWAKERGLPPMEGHRAGYDVMKRIGPICLEKGIEVVTVFAFSTENWKRSETEVSYLMNLLQHALHDELDFFLQQGIRLRVLGRSDHLSPVLLEAIKNAEEKTAHHDKLTLAICLNYGGRPELVDAVKKIVMSGMPPEAIDESTMAQYLYWPNMPDPDMIVRTSGEERLSGFLPWQSTYSEFFWIKKHWPDFNESDVDEIIRVFGERQRRYGG